MACQRGMPRHLLKQNLVVDFLLELSLGPFLQGRTSHRSERFGVRPSEDKHRDGKRVVAGKKRPGPTFFLPLLELDAAKALASFDFCSFGACAAHQHRVRRRVRGIQNAFASGRRAATQRMPQNLTMVAKPWFQTDTHADCFCPCKTHGRYSRRRGTDPPAL